MKHSIFLLLLATAFLSTPAASVLAQPCCLLDIGIFNNPANSNLLEIRIRPTLNVSNGNYSSGIFTVRYPSSLGVTLIVLSSDFGYMQGAQGSSGGYEYYAFTFGGSNAGLTWTNGQEIVAAVLQHSGGMGIEPFELTTDAYASFLTGGDPFYQELAANNVNGGGAGQQNIIYEPTTATPLPVELSNFTAAATPERTVNLDWHATTEINMAYYGVEHSTDGRKFSQFGQVVAKGTTSTATDYAYIHEQPQSGLNYYRLRLVNRDGTFGYSPIRSVRLEHRNDFSLVPTPTTGPLTLLSKNLEQYPAGLNYQLTDNSGKVLLTDGILNERTDFNLSAYAPGIYYLTVSSDRAQVKQFKVIVSRD